jgi:hypothetical protein
VNSEGVPDGGAGDSLSKDELQISGFEISEDGKEERQEGKR